MMKKIGDLTPFFLVVTQLLVKGMDWIMSIVYDEHELPGRMRLLSDIQRKWRPLVTSLNSLA